MISLIVAVAENGVIGRDGTMPWHIGEDLRHFKRVTLGHPVVMGRKTYESLGRPLPGRTNVVVTRNADYSAPGCTVVGSLDEALALFGEDQEVFVIGGGQIYAQAMPLARRLYLTTVCRSWEGDVRFPAWDREEWVEAECVRYACGEKFPYPFTIARWERK